MQTTIRAHLHDKSVSQHNERDEEFIARENAKRYRYDPEGTYECWMKGDERAAYEVIFGDALAEYNAKQKREDRKMIMSEYIEKVRSDTRGRVKRADRKEGVLKRVGKATSYEFVVSVGNVKQEKDNDNHSVRNANGSRSMPFRVDPAVSKNIMRVYWGDFQKRNPNLKLYAIDYHADEVFKDKTDKKYYKGTEHTHGRFIPAATGYKTGLSIQSSMTKALAGQGFYDHYEMQPDGENKWVCAYTAWEASEMAVLEEITKSFLPDVEIIHPCRGLGLESQETETYQAIQDLETAKVDAEVETEWLKESMKVLNESKEALFDDIEQLDIKRVDSLNEVEALTSEVGDLRDKRNARIKDLETFSGRLSKLREQELKALEIIDFAEKELSYIESERARVDRKSEKLELRENRVKLKTKAVEEKYEDVAKKYDEVVALYDSIQQIGEPPDIEEYLRSKIKTTYKISKQRDENGVLRQIKVPTGTETMYDDWLKQKETYKKAVSDVVIPAKTVFYNPFDDLVDDNDSSPDLEL